MVNGIKGVGDGGEEGLTTQGRLRPFSRSLNPELTAS